MKIEQLVKDVRRAPTLMGVEEEKKYISSIMTLSHREIEENFSDFIDVLDRLDESHSSDGYLEVDDSNKDVFLEFAKWLESLPENNPALREYEADLSAYADSFRFVP